MNIVRIVWLQSFHIKMSDDYIPHHFRISASEFWWPTGFFFGLAIILVVISFFVKPGTKSTVAVMGVGSCMCFWLLWFCTYAAQVNPLITPELGVTDED